MPSSLPIKPIPHSTSNIPTPLSESHPLTNALHEVALSTLTLESYSPSPLPSNARTIKPPFKLTFTQCFDECLSHSFVQYNTEATANLLQMLGGVLDRKRDPEWVLSLILPAENDPQSLQPIDVANFLIIVYGAHNRTADLPTLELDFAPFITTLEALLKRTLCSDGEEADYPKLFYERVVFELESILGVSSTLVNRLRGWLNKPEGPKRRNEEFRFTPETFDTFLREQALPFPERINGDIIKLLRDLYTTLSENKGPNDSDLFLNIEKLPLADFTTFAILLSSLPKEAMKRQFPTFELWFLKILVKLGYLSDQDKEQLRQELISIPHPGAAFVHQFHFPNYCKGISTEDQAWIDEMFQGFRSNLNSKNGSTSNIDGFTEALRLYLLEDSVSTRMKLMQTMGNLTISEFSLFFTCFAELSEAQICKLKAISPHSIPTIDGYLRNAQLGDLSEPSRADSSSDIEASKGALTAQEETPFPGMAILNPKSLLGKEFRPLLSSGESFAGFFKIHISNGDVSPLLEVLDQDEEDEMEGAILEKEDTFALAEKNQELFFGTTSDENLALATLIFIRKNDILQAAHAAKSAQKGKAKKEIGPDDEI